MALESESRVASCRASRMLEHERPPLAREAQVPSLNLSEVLEKLSTNIRFGIRVQRTFALCLEQSLPAWPFLNLAFVMLL